MRSVASVPGAIREGNGMDHLMDSRSMLAQRTESGFWRAETVTPYCWPRKRRRRIRPRVADFLQRSTMSAVRFQADRRPLIASADAESHVLTTTIVRRA